jgi:hypothetical protein
MVWLPSEVPHGIVKVPEPEPVEFVAMVPRVTGSLCRVMVKVSLKHVPEIVTVIVPPAATVEGETVTVTVQGVGPYSSTPAPAAGLSPTNPTRAPATIRTGSNNALVNPRATAFLLESARRTAPV